MQRASPALAWSLTELSFNKIVDGQRVSYVKNLTGYSIFADIRVKEKIEFYIYKAVEKLDRKLPSSLSFDLADRFTKGLSERWQKEFENKIHAEGRR